MSLRTRGVSPVEAAQHWPLHARLIPGKNARACREQAQSGHRGEARRARRRRCHLGAA